MYVSLYTIFEHVPNRPLSISVSPSGSVKHDLGMSGTEYGEILEALGKDGVACAQEMVFCKTTEVCGQSVRLWLRLL